MALTDELILPEPHSLERNFLVLLESHLHYLRNHPQTTVRPVSALDGDVYTGDFYGLLDSILVEKKYQYPVMRVNGLRSSSDYAGKELNILIPPFTVIDQLTAIALSVER